MADGLKSGRRLRVVVCWTGLQGYAAACFRALHATGQVDLTVLHLDLEDVPRREELLADVPNHRLLARAPEVDIAETVAQLAPDSVLLNGWFYAPYRQLVRDARLRRAKFVLGIDTPWTGSMRQHVNTVRLRRFVSRMDRIVVAGPRAGELARRLGAPSGKIVSGLYGFDFTAFRDGGKAARVADAAWPRRFLFAGRYVHSKAVLVMVAAYREYRTQVSDPWPLDCCGTGPEARRLQGQDGITDVGYLLPSELPTQFSHAGVFVMPSLEEPWGVAIAEAAGTGLPLICSDVCGAAADLMRPPDNGLMVPAGDPAALAAAMTWMHEQHARLPAMGRLSQQLAEAFSAEAWAQRMHRYLS